MNQSSDAPIGRPTDGKLLRLLPWIAGALALGLIFGYAIVFRALPINERPDAWGQFGDFMGGLLNPLISLFTLIVAVSVWNLQKTELLETRLALEDQGKTAEQQRREQRFFDLLSLYQATVDTIVYDYSRMSGAISTVYSAVGKRAFALFTSQQGASPFHARLSGFFEAPGSGSRWELPSAEYTSVLWNQHSPMLDHYFRVIFTLLREAESLLQDDRYRYIKILRAQLSRDEVSLITMNLLYDEEGGKMRGLVKEYGLLKHLPQSNLRLVAEKELHPMSFGRKWATDRLLVSPDFHAD